MSWLVISHFLQRVASNPFMRYVAGALSVLLIAYGLHLWGYIRGGVDKAEEYEEKIAAETQRLLDEKQLAEQDAQRRILELIAQIQERDNELEHIRTEAGEDPNAARPSLGLDSVRRLNRGR